MQELRRFGISGIVEADAYWGVVRLQVTVSPRGLVDSVGLLGENPALAESAIKAVKRWVHAAGPSRTTFDVTVAFKNAQ